MINGVSGTHKHENNIFNNNLHVRDVYIMFVGIAKNNENWQYTNIHFLVVK